MAKSVEGIKVRLKALTTSQRNVLTLQHGTKKYALPFEVRMIESDDYLFVHVPPSSEIMKVTRAGLVPVRSVQEAGKANEVLRRARRARKAKRSEVPETVKQALKAIPPGFKLGYDSSGNMKLVKSRRESTLQAMKERARATRRKK